MTDSIQRLHSGARTSRIVRHGGLIFLAGQTSNGTALAGVADQTREVLRRIDELLAQAGSDKSRLLSVTIYLSDITLFDAMNMEWDAWVPAGAAPARATVEARLASPELVVEMSVIAAA